MIAQDHSRPLVSVVVPAFNAEATLAETLRSALSGTYKPIEVILVDDGSTDRTARIGADFARRDGRVRLLQRPNGGLSAALNSGFAAVRGDYVARLDADDLWHPTKLERQIEVAQRDPDLAFIYTFVRYIDEEGRVIADAPAQRFARHALCRGLYESLVGGGSSALMKRSAVEEAGGCDESFRSWEDLLLQLAISAKHPIGFVPQFLTAYRVRDRSLSGDIDNMLCTWRTLRAYAQSKFPEVPGHVHDWAHGGRCAMFAEGFAWRRRYVRSAALLIEALWHDPAWTSRFLRFRLARLAAKKFRRMRPLPPGPHFLDCEPDQPIRPEPFAQDPVRRRMTMLEEQRAQALASLDERLAHLPTGKSQGS